ncbi:MAG: NADH-quinone oxidoreductase subunit A [Chloroflexota bacterium]
MPEGYALNWAAAVIAVVVGVVAMGVMFALSGILAPRRPSANKAIPYESGIRPAPYAWSQVHIRYYIFGILFLIFDVEAVFIFPWAVVFMQVKQDVGEVLAGTSYVITQALANAVFYEMLLFIAILAFGIVYGWRKGVLQWR